MAEKNLTDHSYKLLLDHLQNHNESKNIISRIESFLPLTINVFHPFKSDYDAFEENDAFDIFLCNLKRYNLQKRINFDNTIGGKI